MGSKEIHHGRWFYSMPETTPNSEGNIVLVKQASVGPVEVFECGLDSNMKPYESYEWLEDDFYDDENYCEEISGEKLIRHIKTLMELFESEGIQEGVKAYEEILRWLKERGI